MRFCFSHNIFLSVWYLELPSNDVATKLQLTSFSLTLYLFPGNTLLKKRLSLIVRVNVVLNRTAVVDSDWRFDNLCGSHLQSQSELYHVVPLFNGGWKFNLANNEEKDDNKKPWRWKKNMAIHPLWKKTVYCCWIITDSPHVNAVNCKLYNVVSKRRNKLKYSYYRQHPAYFPQIYFEFLINSALPDSNSVCWQNFLDKILKIINFACVKYLVLWCSS